MKILIATNNQHKISEIQNISDNILGNKITFISPASINIGLEPAENGKTFAENAEIKAIQFHNEIKKMNLPAMHVLADDSGLEVEALGGLPGVYSARFCDISNENMHSDKKLIDKENRDKLLNLLIDKENRQAKFTTVIASYDGVSTEFYVGECRGRITHTEQGTNGFGYDSIFMPNNYCKTFAEMNEEEKNAISHRHNAIMQFLLPFNLLN